MSRARVIPLRTGFALADDMPESLRFRIAGDMTSDASLASQGRRFAGASAIGAFAQGERLSFGSGRRWDRSGRRISRRSRRWKSAADGGAGDQSQVPTAEI